MAYVIEGGKECLLGHRDGEALGVICINPEGDMLEGDTVHSVSTQSVKNNLIKQYPGSFRCSSPNLTNPPQNTSVSRLETLHKILKSPQR